MVDARTNTLFVQDTPTRLEEVRKLLAKIDVPVRQVMIEARIVEASDTFSKNLGVRMGYFESGVAGRQPGLGINGPNVGAELVIPLVGISFYGLVEFVHVVNAFAIVTQAAAVAIAFDMWEDREFEKETEPGTVPAKPFPAKPPT